MRFFPTLRYRIQQQCRLLRQKQPAETHTRLFSLRSLRDVERSQLARNALRQRKLIEIQTYVPSS